MLTKDGLIRLSTNESRSLRELVHPPLELVEILSSHLIHSKSISSKYLSVSKSELPRSKNNPFSCVLERDSIEIEQSVTPDTHVIGLYLYHWQMKPQIATLAIQNDEPTTKKKRSSRNKPNGNHIIKDCPNNPRSKNYCGTSQR